MLWQGTSRPIAPVTLACPPRPWREQQAVSELQEHTLMRFWRRSAVAGAIGLACAAWCLGEPPAATKPAQADASSASAVRAAVQSGVDEALAVLRDTTLTPAQKKQGIKDVFAKGIDFDTLSRLALGPSWSGLTDPQRVEFVKEFRTHLLAICGQATEQYKNEEVTLAEDRQEPRGDWTVQTRITRKKADGSVQQVANVDFRMRLKNDRWQMIDVSIEGIRMAAGFRAQFQAVMADGGIDRVLKTLREKNAAREKADRESHAAE
jgi:phospholipid transport system substrate-binding protein